MTIQTFTIIPLCQCISNHTLMFSSKMVTQASICTWKKQSLNLLLYRIVSIMFLFPSLSSFFVFQCSLLSRLRWFRGSWLPPPCSVPSLGGAWGRWTWTSFLCGGSCRRRSPPCQSNQQNLKPQIMCVSLIIVNRQIHLISN